MEVGFLSEGSFAGLEDLILNRCRTSTLIARSNIVEMIYFPLTSQDIGYYLEEDKEKSEIA